MPPVGQVFTDAQIAAGPDLHPSRVGADRIGRRRRHGEERARTDRRSRAAVDERRVERASPQGPRGPVPLTCRAAVRLLTHRLTIVGAFLFATGIASADQWPEFRGPTGQGHSAEQGLPLEWSESRNVRWKVPVPGAGWSSPVIADGRIWLTTATEGEAGKGRRNGISLRALAFDVSTGRELVNVEVFRVDRPEAINGKNSRASPTPIVDGDRVYVHFGAEGTAALSTSGEVLWRTRLAYASQHGSGGSPVLYGDRLIVNCDGNGGDAFVAALDVRTGKIRWRTERRQPADQAYSTPLVIRVGDQDQVVSVGAYRTAAYDPATGKEIWRVSYGDGFSNVPRPVYGDGLVYIATGFQQPALLAVRTDGKGDVTNTHVAWSLKRAAPYTPSPVLVRGPALCRQRRRHRVLHRRGHRGHTLAAPVAWRVFRVTRLRRRPHLFSQRGWRGDRYRRLDNVPSAGREPARWRHAGIDGRREPVDFHSHGEPPVSARIATLVRNSLESGVNSDEAISYQLSAFSSPPKHGSS